MEIESNVVGTAKKNLDGLLIMDRFTKDTEPTKEEKDREARKAAYEKKRAEGKK